MDLTSPGMSFRVRQFHVSQMSAQKSKKKMTPVQKKTPKPTHKYLFSQCQEGCAGSEHSCLTAAAEQELAPAKYWQKLSPGIHLSCQSSEQRFPFPLPGDVGVRWDIGLGRSRELAHTVPALQTEIIFFSNLSVKSVMWGSLFFCNCILY